MTQFTVAVVGNPNCGKTTLFNALTGARQRVGNWPGVTVERKTGTFNLNGQPATLVDLPGTYSLGSSETSLDERVALEYAVSGEADVLVNIVDASNLERNLYLTTQLLEMRVPMLVVLNMMDVVQQNGMTINKDKLAAALGCPVVEVVASRRKGLDDMKAAMIEVAQSRAVPKSFCTYDEVIEKAIAPLAERLPESAADRRWQIVQMLDGDENRIAALPQDLQADVRSAIAEIEETLDEDLDILLADGRYSFAGEVVSGAVKRPREVSKSLTDKIDRIVLHRVFGIPIFLAIMYLMFMWTINLGSAFIDFFDIGVGSILVDGLGHAMQSIGSPEWLTVFVANGIGGGIQTVSTFIPVIGFLYIFLSILEDTGYLARAAFVMDRFMRAAGLPGKAFVPLIVGFGCNVPAIMASRTLDNESDRKTSVMMAPFMSCGARLPVYALFAAAFFPSNGQNLVFLLYLIGIGIAILTGFVLKATVLRGQSSPLLMELPQYHLPHWSNVFLHTWDRLKAFVMRAGRVIVIMVAFLSIVNAIGVDGSFGHADTDKSVLAVASQKIAPVFSPMGLDENNWPAIVGVVTGVFAKEALVGTLNSLYSSLAADDNGTAEAADDQSTWQIISGGVAEAFASIPANLADLASTVTDPLGLSIGDVSSVDEAASEQDVSTGTFGAMSARFAGTAGAFAYLLFVLLYTPCVAAIGAIHREVGSRWTGFALCWTTGMAYGIAVIFYQAANLTTDPVRSMSWILIVLACFAAVIGFMRRKGVHDDRVSVSASLEAGE